MKNIRIAAAAGLLMLGVVDATIIDGQAPAFDVASVKPNKARVRQSMTMNPGGIAYTSVSLIESLQAAYGVKRYQIAGPDWLASERYDINARTGAAASNEQIKVAVAQAEPSVFGDALDAVGLKLDSQKAPIEMLVVDRADRVPTED